MDARREKVITFDCATTFKPFMLQVITICPCNRHKSNVVDHKARQNDMSVGKEPGGSMGRNRWWEGDKKGEVRIIIIYCICV